jgi:18S rRNA (adenine1779-N6/adenine1780-N6)-dimethyltransferase
VDRKSFNPPPEVDSMVVRFVPHEKPIDVPFNEFDGLLRVCFTRKNKTLRSSFVHKNVIRMIEANYKIYKSLHDNGMEDISNFKSVIEQVLTESGLSDMRASKINLDQYLALLLAFNRKGIHFSNETGENGVIEHDDDMMDDDE